MHACNIATDLAAPLSFEVMDIPDMLNTAMPINMTIEVTDRA